MRLARGPDDADVIRARLRALLAEGTTTGWVPGDPPPAAPIAVDPLSEPEGDDGLSAPPPAAVGRHREAGPTLRIDPGRPGARALWAAAVVAVLVLLAVTWRDRPSVTPVPIAAPAPTSPSDRAPAARSDGTPPAAAAPTTVVVSVVGRVARPGLVTLPEGARVADAVEAAGGLLPGTDATSVNLASLLTDGQQVAVGVPGAAASTAPGGASGGAGGPVDVNSAGVAELETLPGVGPVLAQRIVDHREENGPFAAVEDLQDVRGIGPAVFEGFAGAVTV